MTRFRDKVVLVTGAGQGLGRAVTSRLVSEGAAVGALDRDREAAAAVVSAIERDGGRALVVEADVSNRDEVRAGVASCLERFGRIDALVNNAGIGRLTPFLESTDGEWRELFEVNLLGSFIVAQEVARDMAKRGSGRIVNVASICAHWANSTATAYSASKAGILALTRGIAMELGPLGITCNAISPGPFETEMLHSLLSEEEKQKRFARSPARRFAKVEEIAAAIAFLASDDASYVNGAVLNIDGGLLIAGMPDGPPPARPD
jgi:NAD(P)-dependent dehydrogenase (short-subunit alcohol dehydrogenase family)